MANLGEWHFGIQMKEPNKRRKANSIEKWKWMHSDWLETTMQNTNPFCLIYFIMNESPHVRQTMRCAGYAKLHKLVSKIELISHLVNINIYVLCVVGVGIGLYFCKCKGQSQKEMINPL
jgi:hypothetical protein